MASPMLGRNLPTPSSPSSLTLGEALAELVEGGELLNGMRMEMKRGGVSEKGQKGVDQC